MTTDERKKLDEAIHLIREVEQSMGRSTEQLLMACTHPEQHTQVGPTTLMFASMELGAISAARAALEELGKPAYGIIDATPPDELRGAVATAGKDVEFR